MNMKKTTHGDTDFINLTPSTGDTRVAPSSKARTTAAKKAPISGQARLAAILKLPVEKVLPIAGMPNNYHVALPDGCDEDGNWKTAVEFNRIAACLIDRRTEHRMRMESLVSYSVARIEVR